MKKGVFSQGGLPKVFMDRFGQHVTGFISGFDRLRFRATLRPLFQPGGLEIYLYSCKVLLKDFAKFAKELTDQIRQAAYSHFVLPPKKRTRNSRFLWCVIERIG